MVSVCLVFFYFYEKIEITKFVVANTFERVSNRITHIYSLTFLSVGYSLESVSHLLRNMHEYLRLDFCEHSQDTNENTFFLLNVMN